ncbi:MAG: FadR family transcriptional regulator [Desulfuromonas sp.]|nr:MAG: FadR family transcriptional regulator [Desulfuromonas sp.]
MTTLFQPIKPKKISEEIVEQIKQLISSGDLKPGERVPSERELSTMLGVSRPSVREAIMVLEAMGFLESRQGGGTYIRSLTEMTIADPLSSLVGSKQPKILYALTEVRMGLETWSAYLAAQRATEDQIQQMRSLYTIMEKQAAEGGWDAEIDAKFHYIITEATQNTIQVHVLNTIHSLFQTTIMVALTEFYQKEGYLERLLTQHRDILEAIEARDPERAQKAMQVHLELVEKKMNEFLEEEKS